MQSTADTIPSRSNTEAVHSTVLRKLGGVNLLSMLEGRALLSHSSGRVRNFNIGTLQPIRPSSSSMFRAKQLPIVKIVDVLENEKVDWKLGQTSPPSFGNASTQFAVGFVFRVLNAALAAIRVDDIRQ